MIFALSIHETEGQGDSQPLVNYFLPSELGTNSPLPSPTLIGKYNNGEIRISRPSKRLGLLLLGDCSRNQSLAALYFVEFQFSNVPWSEEPNLKEVREKVSYELICPRRYGSRYFLCTPTSTST
jgi:hypothetical protein